MTGRGGGAVIILDCVGYALSGPLFFKLELSARDNLSFALTVSAFGSLEDVDQMLALMAQVSIPAVRSPIEF